MTVTAMMAMAHLGRAEQLQDALTSLQQYLDGPGCEKAADRHRKGYALLTRADLDEDPVILYNWAVLALHQQNFSDGPCDP